jgi:hypothetical protein
LSRAQNPTGFFKRSFQSASRRRAVAALWRAAKAEGLAHSKALSHSAKLGGIRKVLECGGPSPLFVLNTGKTVGRFQPIKTIHPQPSLTRRYSRLKICATP